MILIVDDDVNLGQSLERMLRYLGREAVRVERPMEALALLRIRKPSLIILDLELPEIDGLRLLRAIRADTDNKAIPVIIYSGDFSAEKLHDAMAAGAQEFIVKGTVGWGTLAARIKKYLGDAAAGHS